MWREASTLCIKLSGVVLKREFSSAEAAGHVQGEIVLHFLRESTFYVLRGEWEVSDG